MAHVLVCNWSMLFGWVESTPSSLLVFLARFCKSLRDRGDCPVWSIAIERFGNFSA